MKDNMNIYYDEEGDYLEISRENASPTYGEEIEDDITLIKSEKNDEIVGIGIINFKNRTKSLKEIKVNLPFNINFSSLGV
ncbi:MAG: DUF2283 domain-containing protein [Candidatus Pacearchaeota archaeon]